ncbi:MAG: helix-turn-helix domain-containing protein [Pseudolysinimonas sp.]
MEFNARLEYRLEATEEKADQLVTDLAGFSPAAGPADNGMLEVWITIQATNLRQAVDVGLALAGKASTAELNAIEVLPTADYDRRVGLVPMPELIGTDDAAELLGISRSAVDKQIRTGKLRGQRVGERTVVLARADVVAAAARKVPPTE